MGTSRGGQNTTKIVDNIQDRGINQVYIIGGDGTQKGASTIFEVLEFKLHGIRVIWDLYGNRVIYVCEFIPFSRRFKGDG